MGSAKPNVPNGELLTNLVARFSEPKLYCYEASASLVIRKLSTDDKKSMHYAEQILRSTFRITIKELREFYEKHEIFALWYKDRMTSATILSVHPTISMVNVVFFATVGYLSNLHFGTVLDNFIKYYTIQRGCSTVVVTALELSVDFWHKQGYKEFVATDEFSRAYSAAGAVQLRNTKFLNFRPDQSLVLPTLKQAAVDADAFLLQRVEKSTRSTIALRVLARHGVCGRPRSTHRLRSPARESQATKPEGMVDSTHSETETGMTESTRDVTHVADSSVTQQPVSRASPAAKNRGIEAVNMREERHKRREQLREYRQRLWRQHLLFLRGKHSTETPVTGAVSSQSTSHLLPTPPHPKRQKKEPGVGYLPSQDGVLENGVDGHDTIDSCDGDHVVEEVFEMKEEGGQRLFLVKRSDSSESSWQPAENILDRALLDPFLHHHHQNGFITGLAADEADIVGTSLPSLDESSGKSLSIRMNISSASSSLGRVTPSHTEPLQAPHSKPRLSPDQPSSSNNFSSNGMSTFKPKPVFLPSTRVLRSAEAKAHRPLL